jgi:hypothetical protein
MSRTTTFENVLMLDADTIREFIEPYDSGQLAQIEIALNKNQRREFLKHIKGRVRMTTEADFRRLSASASLRSKAAAQGRFYINETVTMLKDMAHKAFSKFHVLTAKPVDGRRPDAQTHSRTRCRRIVGRRKFLQFAGAGLGPARHEHRLGASIRNTDGESQSANILNRHGCGHV